ncbi:MAG: DUF3575 domain-containing protein [Prevotellaceae bacterium]|nr:DUF3575 domain-containing protein [Prevotellaceae bacterium]
MFNICRGWLLVVGLVVCAGTVHAQRIAVKTNALYWAALTPNMGFEFTLSRHFTLNIEGDFSPFDKIGQYGIKHGSLTPEVRYWFSGRPQTRHFVGVAGMATMYDLQAKNTRHSGDAFGGGVTYGYSYVLNRHWSIEGTVGLGLLHRSEMKYACGTPMPDEINHRGIAFAPIKLGISAVYIIK